MRVDASGVYRCVLFLNNANDDGIIVMDTPDDREIAYVPYAKYYAEMESHPSLKKFHKNIYGGDCCSMLRRFNGLDLVARFFLLYAFN